MNDKFKVGDTVLFTEDDWENSYKGVIKDKTVYMYYIESKSYGNFYIAKKNVKEYIS